MAFISFSGTVLSFATSEDLDALDARLFEQNEGLDANYIQDQLIRSTARILELLRSTTWWRSYFVARNTGTGAIQINTVADVPPLDPILIQHTLCILFLCAYHFFDSNFSLFFGFFFAT